VRTPTEHIRVEAKRMAIDLEKRRIAGTLTLAQEESMESWLAYERARDEWTQANKTLCEAEEALAKEAEQ